MEKYIYKQLVDFDFAQKAALCTQLQHRGSVPRKDYPLMLVLEKGRSVGTIGGGLLEHKVIELARKVISSGQSIWRTFQLTNEDPQQEGGTCGGTSRILIEPYTPPLQQVWKGINLLNPEEPGTVLITEVQDRGSVESRRYLVGEQDVLGSHSEVLTGIVQDVRSSGATRTAESGDTFYLVQRISPVPVLHIFGAGHVGRAVTEIARFVELDVIVYDDRPDLATTDNLPHARQIVVDDFANMPDRARTAPKDFVLVMTRGHQHDLQLLRWLLKREIHYLGLMSSERKWQLLSDVLHKEGYSQAAIASVHAPVGLPIESETVPEIAVSIIAEIIQSMRVQGTGDEV
jgi:xanthine dehydrogenase accessory factor